jgi:hypothetical protein
MMIESHLTLCAIVGNYRSNPYCSSATFLGMLETWAEEVFAAEVRPIDYGLIEEAIWNPTGGAAVVPECPLEADRDGAEALQARVGLQTPENGQTALDGPEGSLAKTPSGRSSLASASCLFCGGAGSIPGFLPWDRKKCRFCGGTGRAS